MLNAVDCKRTAHSPARTTATAGEESRRESSCRQVRGGWGRRERASEGEDRMSAVDVGRDGGGNVVGVGVGVRLGWLWGTAGGAGQGGSQGGGVVTRNGCGCSRVLSSALPVLFRHK